MERVESLVKQIKRDITSTRREISVESVGVDGRSEAYQSHILSHKYVPVEV